ncbi:FAD-dependent oxidoreductase [Leptolyngbya sp. FACHB-16]|nr:FAD-dependent oxidoreductase [Leptolyngbya sp. FACHB-16]MBD1911741.1 FAD-dependent oxidoreductase [Leptolyngbya sp. FACHB-8]MBD2158585.1 FAD-dependent oxidoreductase [Leptolyngbya sp. FACHB-16]
MVACACFSLGLTAGTVFWNPSQPPEATEVVSQQEAQPVAAIQNGRPQLSPLPEAEEVWACDVVVIGGSLGGIAAATHAMQAGAVTCLIELTPWLGGQISSQGVSAIDESRAMQTRQNHSQSWLKFKQRIAQQPLHLPAWLEHSESRTVKESNSCWVGKLCFPPKAGAIAAREALEAAAKKAPGSRWETAIAFKGATFDATGREIIAIHALRRVPHSPDYVPAGRFSKELAYWYSWSDDAIFEKIPLRLEAFSGKRLMVIDATDTGELVGWAGIPHRLGSESKATTQEANAASLDNPECTQAFTYPFALALHDDGGTSHSELRQVQPLYGRHEHRREYDLQNMPTFSGKSFFNYRRIVSSVRNDPFTATPVLGDVTMVNWNQGNDWNWMNPSLILTDEQLDASGQRQNWLGGISEIALRKGEDHALLFAEWLLETQVDPEFPLTYLMGADSPMGTVSGLSMVPYIREGRRILGRKAYGQEEFMIRESDLRRDMSGGRDFSATKIGITHYDLDMHGCRYRNWQPSGEASTAPAHETKIHPVQIPLESLIPQGVDNLLIGGKSIAVTHIVNAVTRVHYGEWTVGGAAGAIAAYLQTSPTLTPGDIVPNGLISEVQAYLVKQGLRLEW